MAQYRKKPVVFDECIEAIQWNRLGDHENVVALELTDWQRQNQDCLSETCLECGQPDWERTHGHVGTKEGGHIVCPGDWIITGIEGEHYPCKPDIFAATYDAA